MARETCWPLSTENRGTLAAKNIYGRLEPFPARGGDLVCLVSLGCLAQRANYTG